MFNSTTSELLRVKKLFLKRGTKGNFNEIDLAL